MEIREFLNNQNWIFSKTYKDKAPHEYCLRKEVNGTDKDFDDAVIYIREHGFRAYFWRKEHIYFPLDGKLYWTMGAPINETILINRCEASEYKIFMSWKGKNGNDLQGD